MDAKDRLALKVVTAVCEAIAAAGDMGAPGGTMYAALMTHGCTLDQFNQIMGALVNAGAVSQSGDLYRLTAKGQRLIAA